MSVSTPVIMSVSTPVIMTEVRTGTSGRSHDHRDDARRRRTLVG
jgi:hypothetical protein